MSRYFAVLMLIALQYIAFAQVTVDTTTSPPEIETRIPVVVEPECPVNQFWSQCNTMCEPMCIDTKLSPLLCPGDECRESAVAGCRCKDGFVRNLNTNQCVLPEECNSGRK